MPINLTLILSGYAAVISTVSLIEKILSYSKKLKVIVEDGAFDNVCNLVLVNYGRRPITIKDISLTIGPEPVLRDYIFEYDQNEELNFPIVLDQYQSRRIQFGGIVSSMLSSSDKKVQICLNVWSNNLHLRNRILSKYHPLDLYKLSILHCLIENKEWNSCVANFPLPY